jgi:hypothetical protein
VPLALPYLVRGQRYGKEPTPAADPKLNALRILSAAAGALLLLGSAALFIAPELGDHWPWPLTPLLARAVAAWYALFGTMLVSTAYGLRRPHEAFIPYATLTCWCVLLLLLPVLHPDDVSGGAAWYAGMVALLALAVYGLLRGAPGFAARA